MKKALSLSCVVFLAVVLMEASLVYLFQEYIISLDSTVKVIFGILGGIIAGQVAMLAFFEYA